MNDDNIFLKPRLVGQRFDTHALPLEILKDLSVLEEFIVEVAKWKFLQSHTDRQRVLKGFGRNISLQIKTIADGSAVPNIELIVNPQAHPDLFSTDEQNCFIQARDCIISAIDAAEHDESITQHLPEKFLGYFDRLGRGLLDGENMEFRPYTQRPARLNKVTRRKLLLASTRMEELTEEIVVRGSVPEADQIRMTFELMLINGSKIPANISTPHLNTVIEAFNNFQSGTKVLIQGVGRYDRNTRLKAIETIEHIALLEKNDIGARLEELKNLKHGWLDGKGFAPEPIKLDWLLQQFNQLYSDALPQPYLYPTAEGGVQAEWTLGTNEISLNIDFDTYIAYWHNLNMTTDVDEDNNLNLQQVESWEWITNEIQRLNGV